MPRKLRGQYPGAIYHVMNRGGREEVSFRGANWIQIGFILARVDRAASVQIRLKQKKRSAETINNLG